MLYHINLNKQNTDFREQFRVVYNLSHTCFGPSWAIFKRF